MIRSLHSAAYVTHLQLFCSRSIGKLHTQATLIFLQFNCDCLATKSAVKCLVYMEDSVGMRAWRQGYHFQTPPQLWMHVVQLGRSLGTMLAKHKSCNVTLSLPVQ